MRNSKSIYRGFLWIMLILFCFSWNQSISAEGKADNNQTITKKKEKKIKITKKTPKKYMSKYKGKERTVKNPTSYYTGISDNGDLEYYMVPIDISDKYPDFSYWEYNLTPEKLVFTNIDGTEKKSVLRDGGVVSPSPNRKYVSYWYTNKFPKKHGERHEFIEIYDSKGLLLWKTESESLRWGGLSNDGTGLLAYEDPEPRSNGSISAETQTMYILGKNGIDKEIEIPWGLDCQFTIYDNYLLCESTTSVITGEKSHLLYLYDINGNIIIAQKYDLEKGVFWFDNELFIIVREILPEDKSKGLIRYHDFEGNSTIVYEYEGQGCIEAATSPDKKYIYIAGFHGRILVIERDSLKIVREIEGKNFNNQNVDLYFHKITADNKYMFATASDLSKNTGEPLNSFLVIVFNQAGGYVSTLDMSGQKIVESDMDKDMTQLIDIRKLKNEGKQKNSLLLLGGRGYMEVEYEEVEGE